MRQSWIRITHAENIPLREGRAIDVRGREIALFNLGDRFVAVENLCPHRGGPLADGIISGSAVVCPLHAWKVDLEEGAVVKPREERACVTTYPVRIDDGIVSIQMLGTKREGAASVAICESEGCEVLADGAADCSSGSTAMAMESAAG